MKLLQIWVILVAGACHAGKTRVVPAQPTPCLVPERPTPPDIHVGVCAAGEDKYVCLTGPDAAALGAYLEALHTWVQIASECPGVGELGAGSDA